MLQPFHPITFPEWTNDRPEELRRIAAEHRLARALLRRCGH